LNFFETAEAEDYLNSLNGKLKNKIKIRILINGTGHPKIEIA
jgi:hypothetical protein